MKRIKVRETLVEYVDFEFSVLGLIENLKFFIKDLSPKEQASATILREYNYDSSDDYNIVYERLETDEEFEKRKKELAAEKEKQIALKKKKEEEELAEYERLKKKFQK